MKITPLFILFFSCVITSNSFANEQSPIEVIEVLSPKQTLSLNTGNKSSTDVDERLGVFPSRTIADKLISISGVNLNGQGGQFQSYSIRGFSRARIRTEVDGIPIITDRRAGNAISFIAPDLITNAHVIKGPSSSIYGSQAMGGVVNLTTAPLNSADSKRLFKVELAPEHGGVNVTFKHNKQTSSTGLAYQKSDNQTAATGDEIYTQFERLSGAFKYQNQHNGFTSTYSWLPSIGKNIGKSNIKYPTREISDYPSEIHSLAQIQLNDEDNKWHGKLYHHYQNWDSQTLRVEQYDGLTQYQSHTLGGQYLAQLELRKMDLERFKLNLDNTFFGLDWVSRKGVKIDSDYQLITDSSVENTLTNQMTGNEDNIAAYVKSQLEFGQFSIDVSLRHDWLKQSNESIPNIEQTQPTSKSTSYANEQTGSITLTYTVNRQFTLAFDVGSTFRYPTWSERFFSGVTPRGFIQGNTELTAETSVGSELSAIWQIDQNINLSAAFYHYDVDNYIERYDIDTANDEESTLSYRNLEQAKISGFETELHWFYSDNIEHHISYQQQSGEDHQQQPLADLHPKQLSITSFINHQDWQLSSVLRHYFSTKKVANSEQSRDSVTLLQLSIRYQLSDNQQLTLGVNNATNETYFASLDEDAGLQPKRNFSISSSWQF